eukprot:gene32475-37431_t
MDTRVILACAFNGTLFAICSFALWRGGRPERVGALVNVFGSLSTAVVRLAFPEAWAPAHYLVTIIDLGVLATFFWLTTHSTRFWPIWASGFALADIIISVAGVILPKTRLFAYHTGLGLYAYLALGALALGTYRLPQDSAMESPDTDLIDVNVRLPRTLIESVIMQAAAVPGDQAGRRLAFAKWVLGSRRRRSKAFKSIRFGEPTWDMILDLYIADREGRRVDVSSLCLASGVAPTTANRYLDLL